MCNLQTTLLCYSHISSFFGLIFLNYCNNHQLKYFSWAFTIWNCNDVGHVDVDGEIGAKFVFLTSKIIFETNIGFSLSSFISFPFISLLFVTATFLSLPFSLSQSSDLFFRSVIMQFKWHELRI